MNDKQVRNIVREYMEKMIIEQDIEISPYTPEEEKFLAKFPELKTTSIGIIYSKDTTGVREFLNRSGKDFNLTPDILHSLLKKGTVSIVPYGGYARNEDYTLQLNIPLDDLEGLSSGPAETDKDKAIATEESVESSQELANLLVTEQKRHTQSRVYTGKSRALKRLPKGYINYLERIIQILGSKLKNEREREQLVADILDNLAHNFGLTPKQVYRSFIYYRSQNRLANVVRESLDEQSIGRTKQLALDGIETQYPKILASIFIPRSSQQALGQFEDTTKKEIGTQFDEFVKKHGKAAVRKRGKLNASLTQLPPQEILEEPEPPTNDAFNIDVEQLFGDDKYQSTELQPAIQEKLSEYRSSKINEIKQQNPGATVNIGLVNYTIISTTSKVPSTVFAGKGGNNKLAQERYKSMKTAFTNAGKALDFPAYPGDPRGSAEEIKPKNTEIGEQGPDYVRDDAKYGPRGNRNDLYQKTFGPYRKTYIKVTVQVLVDYPPVQGEEIPGAKSEVYQFSLRKKPGIKITIPPIRIGRPGNGLFSTKVPKPGKCPAFGKGKIKTPMGMM